MFSGDYQRAPDPTCAPFERVPCEVLVTEATFGLPVYRWPDTAEVIDVRPKTDARLIDVVDRLRRRRLERWREPEA